MASRPPVDRTVREAVTHAQARHRDATAHTSHGVADQGGGDMNTLSAEAVATALTALHPRRATPARRRRGVRPHHVWEGPPVPGLTLPAPPSSNNTARGVARGGGGAVKVSFGAASELRHPPPPPLPDRTLDDAGPSAEAELPLDVRARCALALIRAPRPPFRGGPFLRTCADCTIAAGAASLSVSGAPNQVRTLARTAARVSGDTSCSQKRSAAPIATSATSKPTMRRNGRKTTCFAKPATHGTIRSILHTHLQPVRPGRQGLAPHSHSWGAMELDLSVCNACARCAGHG